MKPVSSPRWWDLTRLPEEGACGVQIPGAMNVRREGTQCVPLASCVESPVHLRIEARVFPAEGLYSNSRPSRVGRTRGRLLEAKLGWDAHMCVPSETLRQGKNQKTAGRR